MATPDKQAAMSKEPSGEQPVQLTLAEWLEAAKPTQTAVIVASDEDLQEHYAALLEVPAILIRFSSFMDGRGFSHGGKLRQLGYRGKLVAGGDILPDQWVFLHRCGFDAMENCATAASAENLPGFSETYQADAREPAPLFRRKRSA